MSALVRRLCLASALVAVSVPGFCEGAKSEGAKSTAAKSEAPANVVINVKKGDQWVYEVRDGLTDEARFENSFVISQISDDEIDVRWRGKNVATRSEGVSLATFDRSWRKKADSVWTFAPYQETMGIPNHLKVGAEWDYSYTATRQNPAMTVKWKGHAKVAAWQRLALPSGSEYDVFRIEYLEKAMTPPEAGPGKENSAKIVEWFAPEVNRYVKRETESLLGGKSYDSSVELLTGYYRHDVE